MIMSAAWLIAAFVIGAYAGITLMAVLAVARREAPLPEKFDQMGELSRLTMATTMRPVETAARPNRELQTRKRNEPKRRRTPDPPQQQTTLQW